MMRIEVALIVAVVTLSACVSTAITPLSQTQFLLNTSAAPICGSTGSNRVASQMAAVETLRQGYDRYRIQGAQSQNNIQVYNSAPTGAYTTGSVTGYGNTAYGSTTTTYYGGGPIITGTQDTQLVVQMLRPGDTGYEGALDARTVLGPEWETLAADGIQTC